MEGTRPVEGFLTTPLEDLTQWMRQIILVWHHCMKRLLTDMLKLYRCYCRRVRWSQSKWLYMSIVEWYEIILISYCKNIYNIGEDILLSWIHTRIINGSFLIEVHPSFFALIWPLKFKICHSHPTYLPFGVQFPPCGSLQSFFFILQNLPIRKGLPHVFPSFDITEYIIENKKKIFPAMNWRQKYFSPIS